MYNSLLVSSFNNKAPRFLILMVASLTLFGCSAGSDNSDTPPLFTPGIYQLSTEVADVVCSDGSRFRKGYIVQGELTVDGEFLLFKNDGVVLAQGLLDSDGNVRLSGLLKEGEYEFAFLIEGQVVETGLTGMAKIRWAINEGLSCFQASAFTATPREEVL